LSEIADKEDISLTPEELDIRVGVLKQRYRGDQQMLAELEKPERRREVGSQVLTEKTVARIIALQN
jgi:FKBP-type peptidyl-prolyl cis-trans isomerase (trigger factor)